MIVLDKALNKFVISKNGEKAYVSYKDSPAIDCLDLCNPQTVNLVELEKFPHCMILDPATDNLYVSCKDSNEILFIDLNSSNVESFLFLDNVIGALAISKDGKKIFAFHEDRDQLATITIETKAIEASPVIENRADAASGKIQTIGLNPAGTHAYIVRESADEIIPINLKSNEIESVVHLKRAIESIDFYPKQDLIASFNVNTAVVGRKTLFDASATNLLRGGEVHYSWDFGDGLQKSSDNR